MNVMELLRGEVINIALEAQPALKNLVILLLLPFPQVKVICALISKLLPQSTRTPVENFLNQQ
jgi:hypothetical protein